MPNSQSQSRHRMRTVTKLFVVLCALASAALVSTNADAHTYSTTYSSSSTRYTPVGGTAVCGADSANTSCSSSVGSSTSLTFSVSNSYSVPYSNFAYTTGWSATASQSISLTQEIYPTAGRCGSVRSNKAQPYKTVKVYKHTGRHTRTHTMPYVGLATVNKGEGYSYGTTRTWAKTPGVTCTL